MKVIHSRGDFVNLPGFESNGTIFTEVVQRDGYGGKDTDYLEATLKLSDCSRTVEFYFAFDSTGSKMNNLHKVDTMIANLKQFRSALAKANRIPQTKKKKTIERIINSTENE